MVDIKTNKDIKPTSKLSERAYDIYVDLLHQVDSSISIDAYELTLLAGYLADYEKINELIDLEMNPFVNKHGQLHPLQTQRNKTIDVILKLGDRFGLNPVARSKSKEFGTKKKINNPLDKFKK